jgi:hypothetical protein
VWRQLHPGPGDYRHEQCEGDELHPHPTGSPLPEGNRSPRELLCEIHGEDRNTADASHFGQDYTGRGSEISTDYCSRILQTTSKLLRGGVPRARRRGGCGESRIGKDRSSCMLINLAAQE